jgi:hypothetical protein
MTLAEKMIEKQGICELSHSIWLRESPITKMTSITKTIYILIIDKVGLKIKSNN